MTADALHRADELFRLARWEEAYAVLHARLDAETSEAARARLQLELVRGMNFDDFKRGLRHRSHKHALLDAVEAVARPADAHLLGRAAYERGMALHIEFVMADGDQDRELAAFTAAREHLLAAEDTEGAAMAMAMIGVFHHVDRLDRDTALPILMEAYDMPPDHRTSLARAEAARHIGQIHQELGEPVRGLAFLEESVAIREASGWPLHLPSAYHVVGYARLEAGDLAGARRDLVHALRLAEQLDSRLTVAMVRRNLADVDLAELAPGVWRRSHP